MPRYISVSFILNNLEKSDITLTVQYSNIYKVTINKHINKILIQTSSYKYSISISEFNSNLVNEYNLESIKNKSSLSEH